MKSKKEIKDKAFIIFQSIFGYTSKVLWIMAIAGGFIVANMRQSSISNIVEDNVCSEMFFNAAEENSKYRLEKGLISKEQIEKIKQELERKRELNDYELTFYDNYLVSCKKLIEKSSKKGFWETVVVFSIFSWLGLYFANKLPE